MLERRDFFLCHASGDKEEYVRPLARALAKEGWSCWLDEAEIRASDSLVERVGNGLQTSRYVIPIMTQRFARKHWPRRELDVALNYENSTGRDIVIPIYDQPIDRLRSRYPFLADKLCLKWQRPLSVLMKQLRRKLDSDEVSFHSYLGEIEAVPVNSRLTIHRLEFGYATQIVRIPATLLRKLPPQTLVPKKAASVPGADVRLVSKLFTKKQLQNVRAQESSHVPHKFQVYGRRVRPDNAVIGVICSDAFYFQEIDNGGGGRDFAVECTLGRGGLGDFVSPDGRGHRASPFVLGSGLGTLGLLTIVEFQDGKPLCRSPYIVLARKGIRYPNDLWFSPKTGRPITNAGRAKEIVEARFMFQSQETCGASSDVFTADFDGGRMCNLSEKNFSAYDGLHDADGKIVGRWINRSIVQFCSNRQGYHRIVTRRDCVPAHPNRAKLSSARSRPTLPRHKRS